MTSLPRNFNWFVENDFFKLPPLVETVTNADGRTAAPLLAGATSGVAGFALLATLRAAMDREALLALDKPALVELLLWMREERVSISISMPEATGSTTGSMPERQGPERMASTN